MAQGSRCPGRTVSLTKWGSGRCGHWRGGELGVQEEAGLWSRPRQSLLPSHWAHQARGCVSKPAAPHPVVDRVVSLAILGGGQLLWEKAAGGARTARAPPGETEVQDGVWPSSRPPWAPCASVLPLQPSLE